MISRREMQMISTKRIKVIHENELVVNGSGQYYC